MKIPVAIVMHQRPGLVRGLMKRIKAYQPEKLWLVADGPRSISNEVETLLCASTLKEAENGVTWPCKIRKLVSKINLGLNARIISGLDTILSEEKSIIFLEEDCYPKPDFFYFCETMLKRYQNEKMVGAISGNSYLPTDTNVKTSYFFSKYLQIWGWALWSRSWLQYRNTCFKNKIKKFQKIFPEASDGEKKYWNRIILARQEGKINSWDYDLLFHFWSQKTLAILPAQNMVANLGFNLEGTNTKELLTKYESFRQQRLLPPFFGPKKIEADKELDLLLFKNHYCIMSGRRSMKEKILQKIQKYLFKKIKR